MATWLSKAGSWLAITMLAMGGSAVAGSASKPAWQSTMETPLCVPVLFQAVFNAAGKVEVSLGGASTKATNYNSQVCGDTIFDVPAVEAALRLYQVYELKITGDNVYNVEADFKLPSPKALLQGIGGNNQVIPSYQLYYAKGSTNRWIRYCDYNKPGWNAEVDGWGDGDGDCDPLTTTFYLQVRPDPRTRPLQMPGGRRLSADEQADDSWNHDGDLTDARTAVGDGDPVAIFPNRDVDPATMSITWSAFMGRLRTGASAGKIRVNVTTIGDILYSPESLCYESLADDTNEIVILKSLSAPYCIKQVSTPQALVWVDDPTNDLFHIKYYLPAAITGLDTNGYFTVSNSATPFVSYRFDCPDTNHPSWRVSEIRNGGTNAHTLIYNSSSNMWTLTRGLGNEARIETRQMSASVSNGVAYCVESQQIANGAGVVSEKTAEVYQQFAWGYELVAVTNDPGGASLVTRFGYYTNTNAPSSYRQIQSLLYPDGFWEQRCYSAYTNESLRPFGALIKVVQPWMNTTNGTAENDCLVTEYTYPNADGSFEMHRWHDKASLDPGLDENDCRSTVYAEKTLISFPCEDSGVVVEDRSFGNLLHYGDWIASGTYLPYRGQWAGHLTYRKSHGYRQDSFDYDTGTWNSQYMEFTPSSAGHDVKQVIYHGSYMTPWDINGNYFPNTYVQIGESTYAIEPLVMSHHRSTIEKRYIQGGNLAAVETYVFTGEATNHLIDRIIYQRDCLGHATNVYRVDPGTLQTRVQYRADWQGTNAWPGRYKRSETDASGVTYVYAYDSLGRVASRTKLEANIAGYPYQYSISQSMSYDASDRVLTNGLTGNSLNQKTINRFDLAGRLTNSIGADQLPINYTYAEGSRQTNITFSSGTTMVISNYLDRRVASITGTAVTNQFFAYQRNDLPGYDNISPKNVATITCGSTNAPRWTATVTDQRYKLSNEQKPGFHSELVADTAYTTIDGLVVKMVQSGLEEFSDFDTNYEYDGQGNLIWQASGNPAQSYLSYESPANLDRVKTFDRRYETDAQNDWFLVNEELDYPVDNDATSVLVSRAKQRLTGFLSTEMSEVINYDADTNKTTVKTTVDWANKKVTTSTTSDKSTQTATTVAVNGLAQTETSLSIAQPTWHFYDALAREVGIRDPLGNSSGSLYSAATGQIVAVTNQSRAITWREYYAAEGTNAGLLKCETNPNGKKTYYNYNGRGQTTHIWGDVPYPVYYEYNAYGDLTGMTTYRGGAQWNGAYWPANPGTGDLTQWQYDGPTGLLTNKVDAASQAVGYDYYANHYPKSSWSGRGLSWSRAYNFYNGDLASVTNADGAATYSDYNRRGQPRVISDIAGDHGLVYDYAGRLISERLTNSQTGTLEVISHYHPVKGRDQRVVKTPSASLTNTFGVDAYGRFQSVTNGDLTCITSYQPLTDLPQTLTQQLGAGPQVTVTRRWENGYRLRSIATTLNAEPSTLNSFIFTYDPLDRRTRATLADGSAWVYGYNDRNEVVSGKRYWGDQTPVSGQLFGYQFDNLGNRLSATLGGDAQGGNLRTLSYTVNNLNQYSSVVTPGCQDISGVAMAYTNVTVNGNAADRREEYFHHALGVANTNQAVWQSVTLAPGNTNLGAFVMPPNQATLTNDADGNLLFDGVWNYQWDSLNRLRSMNMTNVSGVPDAARKRLEFGYDYQGRRVKKVVSTWNGSAFSNPSTNWFIYDGWNLVAIVDPPSSILQSFVWGQDLSGTLDGAGGIGGLLAIHSTLNSQPSTFFPAYDGNGNVTALVNAGDGSVAARYEYSPFGELIRSTGPMAKANPFRWSTKYWDEESGLVYYGYRYYSPSLGRWLSKDPIGEDGGLDLYAFCANNGINSNDILGESIVGKIALLGAKGIKKVFKIGLNYDEAVKAAKQGEDILSINRKTAKEIAEGVGDGKVPIWEIDKKTGRPHYHDANRSGGHILYSGASMLTFEYYAEGKGQLAEGAAAIGDLFNPLSLPKDIVDIVDLLFGFELQ